MIKKYFTTYTVNEWQTGILINKGTIEETLKPGIYKFANFLKKDVYIFDMRQTFTRYVSGDLRTKDAMSINISLSIPRKIVDAKKLLKNAFDSEQLIITTASMLIEDYVAGCTLNEALTSSSKISEALHDRLKSSAKEVGIEIIAKPHVNITIPRSLRRAFEAEIIAKKKAHADLEEARGKTAVLRHLANSADMIKKNPELYKLLLSQKVRSLNINLTEK